MGVLYGGSDSHLLDSDIKSLGDYCYRNLAKNGDKVVIIDGITDEKLTAAQILQSSLRLANSLHEFGIRHTHKIAICSENRIEYPSVIFASFFLNASIVPINLGYTENELNHGFDLSKPTIVFASESSMGMVFKVAQYKSFIQQIVLINSRNEKRLEKVVNVEDFIGKYFNSNLENSTFLCKPIDIKVSDAVILFSSGTTGLPKGVQLTQRNILYGCLQQVERFSKMQNPTNLGLLPWYHTFGCLTLIGSITYGSTIICLPKFVDKTFLGALEKFKINAISIVPPLMLFLAKHPLVDKYDLSNLQVIAVGAAPISKETIETVKQRLGVKLVRQGFGMTEATLSVLAQNDAKLKPGSVGSLREGIYGKIIDTENGRVLGPNERGEMLFKGNVIMKGYINDAEATKMAIDSDGWLHSGDIGYYDEDEEWFVVDRIKELIKYKAAQVPPAELEALLLQHPCVQDVAVIGVPDEEAGELPLAFVVKRANAEINEFDIIDFVKEKSSHPKRLYGGVRFVNEIPKSATGKILRRILRDRIKSERKSKL